MSADVIDDLVGAGQALSAIRDNRPEARRHAQGSYEALLQHPADVSHCSLVERHAVALFLAALLDDDATVSFYGRGLLAAGGSPGLRETVLAEAERSRAAGPYGAFRGELVAESAPGPEYRVDSLAGAALLDDRLSAALEYTHFLALHPRDADRARLQSLLDAGWDTTGIVTLSQLIAFLSFQLRVVHGLRVLAAAEGTNR